MSFDKNSPAALSSLRDVLTDEKRALQLATQMAAKSCRETPPDGADVFVMDSFIGELYTCLHFAFSTEIFNRASLCT